MKQFYIKEVLIYNPTLKSTKPKPIQSDIQEAKIIAYVPPQLPIEHKCNAVGMAEGVYYFSQSLTLEAERGNSPSKQMVVFMDSCCLVQKQVEEDTWMFLQLEYHQKEGSYMKIGEKQENTYIDSVITEKLALKILDHFYLSFKLFYGKLSAYLYHKKTEELQKTLENFVVTYHELNRFEDIKKLDISSYLFSNIRAIPLDVNSVLKFGYFKNVMESYDPNVADVLIFSHGMLAYSTLPKEVTEFFAHYFYGVGEPYRFQSQQFQKRLNIVG